MATALSFSLTPEATSRLYDALVCLAKFGESVSIEAKSDKARPNFTITALNIARTAYASFALNARTFFLRYSFNATASTNRGDRFTCQLLNKALQSVFRGRGNDMRGRESLVERCDVTLDDQPDKAECRLVVKMLCKHGMTKTYRLTYESVEVMHALFDRAMATQGWRISSRVLREYIEFFGPKTEQLDLLAQEGKAVFTSFTERVADDKQTLKQPLETAITLHTDDFEDFHMQKDLHIVISVKDFKAIVTHAETLRAAISAHFSYPARPLQFSYQSFGLHAEFTLMTSRDARAASSTPNPAFISNRSSSRQASFTSQLHHPSRSQSEMPPPALPRTRTTKPPVGRVKLATDAAPQPREAPETVSGADADSLFLPTGEDDPNWDPPNYQLEDAEEMLGWDASGDREQLDGSFHATFRDSASSRRVSQQHPAPAYDSQEGLEPTQRLSQLHGMFD